MGARGRRAGDGFGSRARDRYDEPCDVLATATGIGEEPRAPLIVQTLEKLKAAGKLADRNGGIPVVGVRGHARIDASRTKVDASFDDGSPAIVSADVGQGSAMHFCFLPGLSYFHSGADKQDGLPVGFSPALRSGSPRG